MTTSLVGTAHEVSAPPDPSSATASEITIATRVMRLWPSAVIGFGAIVTMAWAAGLVWLLRLVV